MGRPPEPRSRSAAARLTGIHESTLRALERSGDLPPATDWTPTDLVWAKVLTAPGVDRTALPQAPATFAPGSYLIAAQSPPLSTAGSLIGVVATLESLPGQSAVVLPVGDWLTEIEAQWP